MESVEKYELTAKNLCRKIVDMGVSERNASRDKLPVMNAIRDRIDKGQLPASKEEMYDIIGIVADYYTASGRISMMAELGVLLGKIVELIEE